VINFLPFFPLPLSNIYKESFLGLCWKKMLLSRLVSIIRSFFTEKYYSILYKVRGAYKLLISQQAFPQDGVHGLIWHKQVLLKVSVFAWRLLRDQLPTKVNLASRGIISSVDLSCVSDCGNIDSAQHLFITCSTFDVL
jgi:hypothetical protein